MMTNIKPGLGIEITSYNYLPSVCYTGMVRWNGINQQLEVMTNDSINHNMQWVPLIDNTGPVVSVDSTYREAFGWIKKKMAEEDKIKGLISKYPGLKDLKEKYEVMLALVQENETNADK